MSAKWLGIYGGFFLTMLALALLVTGVFQQHLLPRLWASGGPAAHNTGEEEGQGKEEAQGTQSPAGAANPAEPTPPPPSAAPTGATEQAKNAVATPEILPRNPEPKPVKDRSTDKDAQVKRLARMYEGMRPKEAASIMEKLERPFAVQVLSEIRDRQAAKILGAMNPATAAELARLFGQSSRGETP